MCGKLDLVGSLLTLELFKQRICCNYALFLDILMNGGKGGAVELPQHIVIKARNGDILRNLDASIREGGYKGDGIEIRYAHDGVETFGLATDLLQTVRKFL